MADPVFLDIYGRNAPVWNPDIHKAEDSLCRGVIREEL